MTRLCISNQQHFQFYIKDTQNDTTAFHSANFHLKLAPQCRTALLYTDATSLNKVVPVCTLYYATFSLVF